MQRLAAAFGGVGFVLRGFRFWGTRPRLALLGAVPPLIVGAVMLALMVVLALTVGDLAVWATPFADDWDDWLRGLVRFAVSLVVLVGAGALCVLMFAGLTLAVGAAVYERISQAVDDELGMAAPRVELPFWEGLGKSVRDALLLAALAVPLGLAVFLVGFVPVIGSLLGVCLGAVVGGRALALELTASPLAARGWTLAQRRAALRARRAESLGFGIACYLLFLVPLVAVFAMPAATAGGTLFARSLAGESIS